MLPGTAFQAVCSWTWRLPAVRCCVFYKKTENEPSGEWRYVTIYFSWQHELFLSAACCPPLISLPICDVCFGIWEKYFPSPAVAVPKEVLHLCPSTKPSQGEEGEKMSIPMELMGCSGWGSWRNVINTCTLTAEKILSGAQGDVWARTGSLGKEFSSSFRVGAACHAQPSVSCCAFLICRLHCISQQNGFHFFTKLTLFNRDQKWPRSFWVLFPCKAVRENAGLHYVELQIWFWKSVLKVVGKRLTYDSTLPLYKLEVDVYVY